jgi:hypothetical protein
MRLRLRTPMLHRRQQLRVDPRQPGQRPGIQAIIFSATFSDQAHAVRMRHNHFVPQLAQQPAYPRRVHPRLQGDRTARHSPEYFLHRLRSRAHLLFQQLFPRFIQPAIPTRSNRPKSKPIVDFRSEKVFVWLPAPVLAFFIAGLLYLLRFERVDNLGAYRIPPETGLLIPSVNNNAGSVR